MIFGADLRGPTTGLTRDSVPPMDALRRYVAGFKSLLGAKGPLRKSIEDPFTLANRRIAYLRSAAGERELAGILRVRFRQPTIAKFAGAHLF